MSEKVAIIGGGIAGLTAAYLLNDVCDITLFEKDGRVGGNTQTLKTSDGDEIDVSIFFFNQTSYSNFFKLLDKLGFTITTKPLAGADMTMLNLDTKEVIKYNIDSRQRFFTRLRPRSMFIGLSMTRNVLRGLKLFRQGKFEGLTMEEALKMIPKLKGHASNMFIFPLCLMSSMYYDELMKGPADYFFGKVDEHYGTLKKATSWSLINCKTIEYVEALSKSFKDRIVLNSSIKNISRSDNSVTIQMADGNESVFDKVIFACNADQALELLEKPTDEEKRLLGVWKYKDGLVVVHKDSSSFPDEKLWSMYDCLYTDKNGEIQTSINACYRYEEGVSEKCQYLGTQHPNFPIDENLIEFQKVFRTPIYDKNSAATIKELPTLNGTENSYYCGSHFGYGLHEDAVRSAIEVAKTLGARWD